MGTRTPPPEASLDEIEAISPAQSHFTPAKRSPKAKCDQVDDRSGASGFYITRRGSVEYIVKTCGASAFAVYSYLLQCANHQTGRCDPSQRTISEKLGMARNTVSAALSALVTEGIIEAKYSEQPKYTSTRWVLKDIGTKARAALRASAPTESEAQEAAQFLTSDGAGVAQDLSQGGSEFEPKIEEGNRRREERDSLSSSSSKTHRESAVVQDLTKSGSGEPSTSVPQKPSVPREEKLRRAEFVVAALYGDIKGVPGSTWGFVNKQLNALEWPPEEDLDGFVKWWRSEFPAIKLTLGAISPKNWPAYLAHKANSAPKYIPRTWQGD